MARRSWWVAAMTRTLTLRVCSRAEALDLLLLQGAQELGLGSEGHVADFVEQEGAVIGVLEQSHFVVGGAGEGAFDVAEEFAFKEGFDDGRAVEGDEGSGGGGAELMEGFGDKLFAGAWSGPGDEHGAVVGGDALDLRVQVPHGRAVADHAGEAGLGGEGLFEGERLEAGAMAGEEGFKAGAQEIGGRVC
jgi:hypothetical protein